jgi:hypothetical protein
LLAFIVRLYHDARSSECKNNLSGLLVQSDNQNYTDIRGSPAGHYSLILILSKKKILKSQNFASAHGRTLQEVSATFLL